jgi:hypothetical protein
MATLVEQYWKDGDGRKHRSFVVRVCGHDGYGNAEFGILDVQCNTFRYMGYKTREKAYADLNSIEC